eukprot:scaffold7045_cov127-Skeletonema_marinoi.AAC.1
MLSTGLGLAVPLQAVLSYLMHIDIGVFEADGGVTYTGDGVVEERVSLLEGFEILCRKGFVHVDFRGSRIGWRQPRSQRFDRKLQGRPQSDAADVCILISIIGICVLQFLLMLMCTSNDITMPPSPSIYIASTCAVFDRKLEGRAQMKQLCPRKVSVEAAVRVSCALFLVDEAGQHASHLLLYV